MSMAFKSWVMDEQEREVQEAYLAYLRRTESPLAMSEDEFYEYYHNKKQAREDNDQFGVGA